MSTVDLRACTRKELATMARRDQVSGWHSMTKDELIRALRNAARRKTVKRRTGNGSSADTSRRNGKLNGHTNGHTNGHAKSNGTRKGAPSSRASAGQAAARRAYRRIAAAEAQPSDELLVQICDSHWLHVHWSLSRAILERAEAALGVEWHQSVPVIRVFDVTIDDSAVVGKSFVRDFEIQGAIDHWYVFLDDPSRSYRLCVGYRTPANRFFPLAESSRIRMPAPASNDRRQTADHRTNGSTNGSAHGGSSARFNSHAGTDLARLARNGNGTVQGGRFQFEIDAELVVHGRTHPDASLTLAGERLTLGPDGSFTFHLMLPEGRQVIPAVAVTPNGAEQRTIILAVERNTKELEPQSLDEPGF